MFASINLSQFLITFEVLFYSKLSYFTCKTSEKASEILIGPLLTHLRDQTHFYKSIFALSSEASLKSFLSHNII